MKKILILLAVAGGGYYYWNKSQTQTAPTGNQPTQNGTLPPKNDAVLTVDNVTKFLADMDGRIVVDSNKYWNVVKNGLIYSPGTIEYLQGYQAKYPDFAAPVFLPFSIWEVFTNNQSANKYIANGTGVGNYY